METLYPSHNIKGFYGSRQCRTCIGMQNIVIVMNFIILIPSVFGWFQDFYVGLKQELVHTVKVGYLKGAEVAGVNISMNIVAQLMESSN